MSRPDISSSIKISRNSSSSSNDSARSLDLSSIQDSNQSWYLHDASTSYSISTICDDTRNSDRKRHKDKVATTTDAVRPRSNSGATISKTVKSADECADMDMATQRECLRERFKEWTGKMDQAIKRLRDLTDNALVNQNMRLEQILHEGKARVDQIDDDQNNIRAQLSSFVSMLNDAQVRIFAKDENGDSRPTGPQKDPPPSVAQ